MWHWLHRVNESVWPYSPRTIIVVYFPVCRSVWLIWFSFVICWLYGQTGSLGTEWKRNICLWARISKVTSIPNHHRNDEGMYGGVNRYKNNQYQQLCSTEIYISSFVLQLPQYCKVFPSAQIVINCALKMSHKQVCLGNEGTELLFSFFVGIQYCYHHTKRFSKADVGCRRWCCCWRW